MKQQESEVTPEQLQRENSLVPPSARITIPTLYETVERYYGKRFEVLSNDSVTLPFRDQTGFTFFLKTERPPRSPFLGGQDRLTFVHTHELADNCAVTPLHEAAVSRRLQWDKTFNLPKRSKYSKKHPMVP